MAISPSALQQKLAERHSSFQDQVSITEMSLLLGFADTSSFNRALRWAMKILVWR